LGFVARIDLPADHLAGAWFEIELRSGEVACKPLSTPMVTGLDAVVGLLDEVRIPTGDVRRAFDEVLGPPLLAHARTLASRSVAVEELTYGKVPAAPRASVVVPLYRRVDLMAWQLALMSAGGVAADEIIYVLDDPDLRDATLNLAEASYASYGLPFRLLLQSERRGFGLASNLGLERARGDFVCFLNSDVFPFDTHWLDRLLLPLERDPSLGAAGGRLLFTDGSVQHVGMRYEAIPAMGNWLFPVHPSKGLRPAAPSGATRVPAVTGACMALRRAVAAELRGFSPDYLIGDFEDADLCERLRARSYGCVVVPDATLLHLERQSQGDAAEHWRRNLTRLNAWTFARNHGEAPGAGAVR
jgi:GT2 family glycosyltransferase